MTAGIVAFGDAADLLPESALSIELKPEDYDAHVFYGLEGRLPSLFGRMLAADVPVVYVDLGFWGRREGGRYAGFHKVSVSSRHPVAYYRRPQHPTDRFDRFRIEIQPWHRGRARELRVTGPILLVGMGAKGAAAEGFGPQEWERGIVTEIRKHTHRQILYRPKPSDPLASRIEGCGYSTKDRKIEAEIASAWAVVTHHSNAAVEAILAGTPAFCWGGVGRDLASWDLSTIENPEYPDGRYEWAADIAYTQFSVPEMTSGICWAHLRREGLV